MSLESFFAPKSVAVVGVSENPAKLGALVFKNLQNAGFNGKLYPVNPKSAGQVLYGETCVTSIKDIKEIEKDLISQGYKKVSWEEMHDLIFKRS